MATLLRDPVSCRYLCFAEREEIALLRFEGKGGREIAREIGRAPSAISRELRRNAATRGGKLEYRPSVAQWKAELGEVPAQLDVRKRSVLWRFRRAAARGRRGCGRAARR